MCCGSAPSGDPAPTDKAACASDTRNPTTGAGVAVQEADLVTLQEWSRLQLLQRTKEQRRCEAGRGTREHCCRKLSTRLTRIEVGYCPFLCGELAPSGELAALK